MAVVALGLFVAVAMLTLPALRSASRSPSSDQPAPASEDPWGAYGEGWTELPPPPEAREGATFAWAGNELLYWGGVRQGDQTYAPTADGYAFDPATRIWHALPTAPLPGEDTRAIWTGAEAIFWGVDEGGRTGGLAFDPDAHSWRVIPPSPHQPSHGGVLVWTGSQLISWGGGDPGGAENAQGAEYDPSTDSWRPIADAPIGLNLASGVWTGHEMIVFGSLLNGRNIASTPSAIGAAYDPTTDSWREIAPSDLSPQASSAVWVEDRMVAWDYGFKSAEYLPGRDEWRPLPEVPGDSGECYVDSAVVAGVVFAWDCGYAAVLPAGASDWVPVHGGVTEPTVTANGRDYRLFRFAQLVPAGDVLAISAEGITVGNDGVPCYGCPGAPTSFWVYRPPLVEVETSPGVEQVYLPPRLAQQPGWVTFESEPVRLDEAAVAWASTIPFAEGDRSSGVAIPVSTIASLGRDDVAVTVETTPWAFDPSGPPYPYGDARFDLSTALRRGPVAEEPPDNYSVRELDEPAALVRVYFGSAAPDQTSIDWAQAELDTLQLPPVCPAPAQGGYEARLSTDHGLPGDAVTIGGPMPFQREDGSYDTTGDEVMIAWWNASPDDWAELSSFSTASPSPAKASSQIVRLGEGGRGACSFSIPFQGPRRPGGRLPDRGPRRGSWRFGARGVADLPRRSRVADITPSMRRYRFRRARRTGVSERSRTTAGCVLDGADPRDRRGGGPEREH